MPEEVTKAGTLRALDLDRDWLEVIDEQGDSVHIAGLQDTVDDVIGPMVNRRVVVRAVRSGRQLRFRDIELDE